MGTDGFAWQRLASTLLKGIEQGVYPIGSRMPSVRDLMYQQGVSRNTILKAYYELESLGKIETREHSGFFVRRAEHRPSSPIATRPEPKNEGITEFFRKPDMLDLGSASLHLSLMPQKTLADLLREAMLQPSLLSYAPVAGLTELRTILAAHMVEGGTPINPEEILVTSGCMEAMNLALDEILLDLPSRLPGNSRMTMPSGGVFLWVEVPDLDAEALFWRLSERGVFILPGTVFSTSGRHANCFRLNISAHCDKDWNRGMRILQEEIHKLVPSVP